MLIAYNVPDRPPHARTFPLKIEPPLKAERTKAVEMLKVYGVSPGFLSFPYTVGNPWGGMTWGGANARATQVLQETESLGHLR